MGKPSSLCFQLLSKYRFSTSLGGAFFFLPLGLAITTFLLLFIYTFTISNINIITQQHNLYQEAPSISSLIQKIPLSFENAAEEDLFMMNSSRAAAGTLGRETLGSIGSLLVGLYGNSNYYKVNSGGDHVYHNRDVFLEQYKEMKGRFKIFIYPHSREDPFSNVLLPVENDHPPPPRSSELFFMQVLTRSSLITKDPAMADLFFMPFSTSKMRHDPRIGPRGMQDYVKDYIQNISHRYPYWNRGGGADHFYVACHPSWRLGIDKAVTAKFNAIQVVCSSSYFTPQYISHKDVPMPQITPSSCRQNNIYRSNYYGDPNSILLRSKRIRLAFFSGSINSLVRIALLKVWGNDSDIVTHFGHDLERSKAEKFLMSSKFCLHVKGIEVNTAQLADAVQYGCVPVIIANHYDLPFAEVLDWRSLAVMVHHMDVPVLKKIIQGISLHEYHLMRANVLRVRNHFQWNASPLDFDAFYMTIFQLWLRRPSVKLPTTSLITAS